MQRTILSLLAASLLAIASTSVLPENVTVGNKASDSAKTTGAEQKEISSPMMVKISGMPGIGMRDTTVADFENADWDRDGKLNRKEARAMPRVARNFDLIDTNNDGFVTMAEDQAYIQTYRKSAMK